MFGTWCRGIVRNYLHQERDRKPLKDTLYDLQDRVTDIEIRAEKLTKDSANVSAEDLPFDTINASVSRAQSAPQRDWVVQKLIHEGEICNLQAVEKSGKSILVTQIAHDYAYGLASKIVPTSAIKGKMQEVFLYDAELCDDDMLERYKDLNDDRVHRCQNAEFDSMDSFLNHIEQHISGVYSNTLVVIDNVTAICPTINAKDVKIAKRRIKKMQSTFLMKECRLTFIFVHHTKTGSDGFGRQDIAGSINWVRFGDLNLALADTRFGDHVKSLSIASGRNVSTLLKSDEALLLEMYSSPYPHFEFKKICKICDASTPPNKRKNGITVTSSKTNIPPAKNSWSLTSDEIDYTMSKYVPGKYGLERIAKDILKMRGLELTDSNVGCMKSAVSRYIKSNP